MIRIGVAGSAGAVSAGNAGTAIQIRFFVSVIWFPVGRGDPSINILIIPPTAFLYPFNKRSSEEQIAAGKVPPEKRRGLKKHLT